MIRHNRALSHVPCSMLNLSMRRKTCLVRFLGWNRFMQCWDTRNGGNCLWRDMQTRPNDFTLQHTWMSVNLRCFMWHVIHTCLSSPLWSWGGTRSPALWPDVFPNDCGLWQRTQPKTIYFARLPVHRSAGKIEKIKKGHFEWFLSIFKHCSKEQFCCLGLLYFHFFATLNIHSTWLSSIFLWFSVNVMPMIFIKDNKQFTFSL